jgi:hypothetical protein
LDQLDSIGGNVSGPRYGEAMSKMIDR